MRGGFSNTKGILLYDTKIGLGVYGYYESDEIVLDVRTIQALKQRQKEDDKPYKKNKKIQDRWVFALMLTMLLVSLFAFFCFTFVEFLSILLFCVITYLPILVIAFAWFDLYEPERQLAFQRHHGAEHTVVKLMSKNEDLTLENIRTKSYYDGECGTAYAGAAILLATIFSLSLFFVKEIGFLKVLSNTLLTFFLLFLNLFNPYNPLKLLQAHVVKKPTDREYLLALEVARKLKSLEKPLPLI